MIKLFNTLTRKLESFEPTRPPEVKLYTCGPTVYDYPQLGNLRSFVFDDTLRRTLEFSGYNVRHVMNITDVGHLVSDTDEGQDKLEKGAKREGKTVWQVADYYTKIFEKDAQSLNILPPNGYKGKDGPYAKATDFINEQVEMVALLLEKGFAYQTPEAIYFDTAKLETYGQLSHQKLSEKEVGARSEVVTDKNKKHPQDFALWFFRVGRFADHTMHWHSPWGDGFPGWHLECSAIIHKTLGDPVDIHTGGVDHIGTHHTNEMAQTEAAYGHQLSRFWLHNEFLLVEGQKMSKSLRNFYTLMDVEKKGYDPLALRVLFMQAHYRSQLNFTWASLEASSLLLNKWQAWADLVFQHKIAPPIKNQESEILIREIQKNLNNDLDTSRAVAAISPYLKKGSPDRYLLQNIDKLLGLKLSQRTDISDSQKGLIAEREKARSNHDWAKSDEIRSKLRSQLVELEDTPKGPVWQKLSSV